MTMPAKKENSKLLQWWPIMIGVTEILLICSLPVIGWGANALVNHESRLCVVEQDMLSKDDGRDIYNAITAVERDAGAAVSQIRQALAGIPSEVPPAWFIQRVDKIESRQDKITDKLEEISDALTRLEGRKQ